MQQTELLYGETIRAAVAQGVLLSACLGGERSPGQWRVQVAVGQPCRFLTVRVKAAAGSCVSERIMNGPEHVVMMVTQVGMRIADPLGGVDPQPTMFAQLVHHGVGTGVWIT